MDDIELGPIERGWGAALGNRAGGACPSASDLVEFVDRGESAKSFGSMVAHLASCPNCRQIVTEMRETEAVLAPKGRPFPGLLRPTAILGGLLGATAVLAAGAVFLASHLRAPTESRLAQGPAVRPSGTHIETNPPPAIEGGPTQPTGMVARGQAAPENKPSGPARVIAAPNDTDDPNLPSTSQQYCLIGSEGVFTMPTPNFHRREREQIEKKFADNVKAARDTYLARPTASGTATAELNRSLAAAGTERERALSAIYVKQRGDVADALKLKIEGEAPYQVVEVHYRTYRHQRKPDRLVVRSPWSGYRPARRPYGWDYDVAYDPDQFRSKYAEWRKGYVAEGRPAFCGLEGHQGPISLPNIVGSRHEGYADRRIAGSYTHSEPARVAPSPTGYTHSGDVSAAPREVQTPPPSGGYTHSGGQAPAGGGYTHTNPPPGGPAQSGTGYTHSAKGTGSGAGSGYTHQRRDGKQNENGGS